MGKSSVQVPGMLTDYGCEKLWKSALSQEEGLLVQRKEWSRTGACRRVGVEIWRVQFDEVSEGVRSLGGTLGWKWKYEVTRETADCQAVPSQGPSWRWRPCFYEDSSLASHGIPCSGVLAWAQTLRRPTFQEKIFQKDNIRNLRIEPNYERWRS